jgi:hypothetical protein
MEYIITAVGSFLAGAGAMFVYHKKVVAQIERAKEQVQDAAAKVSKV